MLRTTLVAMGDPPQYIHTFNIYDTKNPDRVLGCVYGDTILIGKFGKVVIQLNGITVFTNI